MAKIYEQDSGKMFPTSVFLLVTILLMCCVRYHWKRRRLYKMAKQRPGPVTLPLIGNAFYFFGSTSHILENMLKLCKNFESPLPIWLGHKLFFGIWEPKDLEIILNSPYALEKDDVHRFLEVGIGTGILIAPVPKWKRHRKIIAPTFNQKILDGFVDIFKEKSEILSKQLEKEVGKGTFNAFHYISRCTMDIICETAMGIKVDAQTTDSDLLKWCNRALEIVCTRMFNILYHTDFIFNLTPLSKELNGIVRKLHTFTEAVIKEKKDAYQKKMKEVKEADEFVEEEPERKAFLELLIELSENGEHFTDKEIREDVNTIMVAGSDSTASIESFTLMMLGMHPHIQQKVYEEIIEVLGFDRPVQSKDLAKFQYTEKVIKETMRLFPVGPILARAVTQDIKLDECIVPAGSSAAICTIGLHRNPNIWPDPSEFDPDRFLPERVAKRHPYSWLPFSGGPRNCIGINFAYMSMKTTIATILRKYRFHTDYKSVDDIKLQADTFLKPVYGYRVSVELRNYT